MAKKSAATKSGSKSCTIVKSYKRKGKTVKSHTRKK